MLEKLVKHVVPAVHSRDALFDSVFLCLYQSFASSRQVLDLLCKI
jgi:hypothetical protein